MIPVEKNKEYVACIDSVSSDGNGVAHIDGFAVFVPQTVDGDKIKMLVVKVQKKFAYGKVLEIIEPSDKRCEPMCPHYKRCGGCQIRHIKYDAQLDIKRDIVENAMQRIGKFENFKVDGIVGMDVPERYRNKMVFLSEMCMVKMFAVSTQCEVMILFRLMIAALVMKLIRK